MDEDPIGCAIAEADLQFAHAASDGKWKDWTDFKSHPPWFSEGVEWIWTVLQAHAEFWQSLTVTDRLDKSREVLTLLADGVFDRLLADHQERKFGQVGLSEKSRGNFRNIVHAELLPRITVRVLSAAVTAQSPARSGPEPAPEAGSRTVAPVLDAGSEGPSLVVAGDNAPAAETAAESAPPRVPTPSKTSRRTPDMETSQKRLALREKLATELATIKVRVQNFCDLPTLRREYPDFELWKHLNEGEARELLDGEFKPKSYAANLTLRIFGLTSAETLKKDSRKLKLGKKAAST